MPNELGDANERGREFEKRIEHVLRTLESRHPSSVQVEAQVRDDIRHSFIKTDLTLKVTNVAEVRRYWIECQDRDSYSQDIVRKLRTLMIDLRNTTFVLVTPNGPDGARKGEAEAHGIVCASYTDMVAFVARLDWQLSCQTECLRSGRKIDPVFSQLVPDRSFELGTVVSKSRKSAPEIAPLDTWSIAPLLPFALATHFSRQFADLEPEYRLVVFDARATYDIEVIDFSHGVSQCNHTDLQITKTLDLQSPRFNEPCCTGKHLSEARLLVVPKSETKAISAQYRLVMHDVVVSSVAVNGSDPPLETITFSYAKIQWEWLSPRTAISTSWYRATNSPD